MKICSLNIQGLRKYNDDTSFKKYCQSFDLISLYETWQDSEAEFKHFLDGYESFESIRKKKPTALRGSGGVSVFVKDWVLQTNGVT